LTIKIQKKEFDNYEIKEKEINILFDQYLKD